MEFWIKSRLVLWIWYVTFGLKRNILRATILEVTKAKENSKKAAELQKEARLSSTFERSLEYGQDFFEGSINDDLDSFINNLQNSNKINYEEVFSFCTPKLTKEELKLVEEKEREHIRTYLMYDPDVEVQEMKESDSKDKYVYTRCYRETVYLESKLKSKPRCSSMWFIRKWRRLFSDCDTYWSYILCIEISYFIIISFYKF